MAPQFTDFQRSVISLFKKEHPTWGLQKCTEVLPQFFADITANHFYAVCNKLKNVGMRAAQMRKKGTGRKRKFNSPVKQTMLKVAVTPGNSPRRRHSSQRQIASALHISKGSVFNILKESDLKCYRRIKCQKLTASHKEKRVLKSTELINRYEDDEKGKIGWFSDEATFNIAPPLNRQNERLYRAVELKTQISEHDLLVEVDRQQPSLMAYATVSWHGKSELRFLEGLAEGQDDVVPSKRKKKTINRTVYREGYPEGFYV